MASDIDRIQYDPAGSDAANCDTTARETAGSRDLRRPSQRRSYWSASAFLLAALTLACSDSSGPSATVGDLSPEPSAGDEMQSDSAMDAEDSAAEDGANGETGDDPSGNDDGPSSGEGLDDMLGLDDSAMQDDMAGAGNDSTDGGDDAASDDTATDDTSPDDMATEVEGEPEPPQVPEFSPCPTDGNPCRIMPLGDSITDGVGSSAPGGGYRVELFRQALADGHDITFVGRQANGPNDVDGQAFPRNHEGYSGATISTGGNQIANRLDGALAANSAHIVLLQIGTNDIYQGMPPSLPDQLGTLIDRITEALPDALVVVAQLTPVARSGAQFNFPNHGVETYNATIPGVVQERADAGDHVILVDNYTALNGNGNFLGLLAEGLHPNNQGYAAMAGSWYAAIEGFLP